MLERGAYRDLLDSYYQSNGKLRSDLAGLYRICGAVMPEEQSAVRQVVADFFQDGDGYLSNPRADREIAEQAAFSDSMAERGRKGADARWHKQCSSNGTSNACANAQAMLADGQSQSHNYKTKEGTPSGSAIWDEGIQLLISRGDSEKAARRFLGSLLKDWDADYVADALRAAESSRGDAKAYVRKILGTKPKKSQGGMSSGLVA